MTPGTFLRLLRRLYRVARARVRAEQAARVVAASVHPDACSAYRYGGVTDLRQAVCGNCGRLAAEHAADGEMRPCRRCGHVRAAHAADGGFAVSAGPCLICDTCTGYLE